MPDLVRYDVVFTGRVQGVGFRYTAARLAERRNIAGWVRNEPDGSVRCVVEGERAEADRFLDDLRNAMTASIRGTSVAASAYTGSEAAFHIRR